MNYRFCPSCYRERPAEGFKLIPTSVKGHRRWKCAMCQEKKSATFYGKQK